ncbi:hypothetical protein GGR50DRAFT_43175 [Xylaria sp. CBS 124048]|nr:hypothetical protein GGR50DRAFT_43175 [Xylaria sp. CBS 124048]
MLPWSIIVLPIGSDLVVYSQSWHWHWHLHRLFTPGSKKNDLSQSNYNSLHPESRYNAGNVPPWPVCKSRKTDRSLPIQALSEPCEPSQAFYRVEPKLWPQRYRIYRLV